MAHDLTERQFEETLFEFAPDAILVVNPDGRISRINPQAEQMFGYTQAELEGQPIERVIPQRYRDRHVGMREGYISAPRTRRMGATLDLWAQRKDGAEFAVEVALGSQRSSAPVAPGEKPAPSSVLCIVRDITDRRQAQAALQRAHDQLEQRVAERTHELSSANTKLSQYAEELERSNRELQDFAYVASHDLQEPLRKIQTFGERLKTRLEARPLEQGKKIEVDVQAADYLGRMQNAAARMQTLINDLLSFSRVTTRAQPFQSIALDRVLNEVLSDLEVRVEESQAKVEKSSLGSIHADGTQMRQLFQNLIGNALKFRDAARPHVVQVLGRRFTDENQREWLELSVEDNGIGFEPKYSERIFGLFQRLHARDDYGGSGVGLAICRKIAERHGGRIAGVGRPGAGSTFTVLLPTVHPDGAAP